MWRWKKKQFSDKKNGTFMGEKVLFYFLFFKRSCIST